MITDHQLVACTIWLLCRYLHRLETPLMLYNSFLIGTFLLTPHSALQVSYTHLSCVDSSYLRSYTEGIAQLFLSCPETPLLGGNVGGATSKTNQPLPLLTDTSRDRHIMLFKIPKILFLNSPEVAHNSRKIDP